MGLIGITQGGSSWQGGHRHCQLYPQKMGPEVSEVLILGVPNAAGETIYLTPQTEVALGAAVF